MIVYIFSLGAFHADAVERARQAVEGVVHQVVSELESGGNIRFEYGKPTDPWYAEYIVSLNEVYTADLWAQ